jgi:hypothetical protein
MTKEKAVKNEGLAKHGFRSVLYEMYLQLHIFFILDIGSCWG